MNRRQQRLIKKLQGLNIPASARTPNERERELGKRLDEIEARYGGQPFDEIPREVIEEYGSLQRELMMEEQQRSGLILIDFKPTGKPGEFMADPSNLFRMANDVAQLTAAGASYETAVARALEDERWRQEQERKAA